MERLQKLEEKIKEGGMLTSEEALWLLEEAPFEELCEVAHRITVAYASRKFDMCSIINAKSGRCPENCKWCAQSVHHHTGVEEYGLVSEEECLRQAKMNEHIAKHPLLHKRLDQWSSAFGGRGRETLHALCISSGAK